MTPMHGSAWHLEESALAQPHLRRYRLLHRNAVMTWQTVLAGLCDSREFCEFFCDCVRRIPYEACYWETPPVTSPTRDLAFEYVAVDAPRLARLAPDPLPFQEHFAAAGVGSQVITFDNLGGDAVLVVPVEIGPAKAYPHLSSFMRLAPLDQQHAFWHTAAATLQQRLGQRPVWLSTAGLGVAWLHLRLDSIPKYYSYNPYRAFPRAP